MVKKINALRGHKEVEVQHILRERNKVAHYSPNLIFFTGTTHINFLDIHQVPKQGQTFLCLDAQRIPNIRITMMQNVNYTKQQTEQ